MQWLVLPTDLYWNLWPETFLFHRQLFHPNFQKCAGLHVGLEWKWICAEFIKVVQDEMTWHDRPTSPVSFHQTWHHYKTPACGTPNHTAVPRKQLPTYCCLAFWFMNMKLSTKPSSCRADNGPESEMWAKGHVVPNEVHRQPLYNLFLLGSQVDAAALSVACSREYAGFFHSKASVLPGTGKWRKLADLLLIFHLLLLWSYIVS